MKGFGAALALAALALAAPLAAKDKDKPATQPPLYQAVVDCRAIVDSAERLACFDRTVGAMAQASAAKDLVVVDRETMRETRKGLFGFNLPKLRLFSGGTGEEEVKSIESKLVSVRNGRDGFPVFTLEDNGRWKQTDGRVNIYKPGDKVEIRRSPFGAYFASVGRWPSVKVIRLPE